MPISEETFLFDVGDHALYVLESSRLLRVVILKRLYTKDTPQYLIRNLNKPDDAGAECRQMWLRSIKLSPEQVRAYMLAHSPPGKFGDFAVRARRL